MEALDYSLGAKGAYKLPLGHCKQLLYAHPKVSILSYGWNKMETGETMLMFLAPEWQARHGPAFAKVPVGRGVRNTGGTAKPHNRLQTDALQMAA